MHYGPTAAHADDNIALIIGVPARGHRRVLHRDDAVGVAGDDAEPAELDRRRSPRRARRAARRASRPASIPGFANDLFPMTLMGLCARGAGRCARSEMLDYTDYEGDYEDEMGIGRPPEFTAAARDPRHPRHGVGRDRADDRARGGHRARRDHHHLGQVGDAEPIARPPRASSSRASVAAIRFTINGIYKGETRIQLEHVNRIGDDAAPDWPSGNAERRLPGRDRGHAVDHPGDRVPVHRRLRPRRRRRRMPGDGAARAQRGARRQRPAAGLGDRARPAADPGGRHDSMTWQTG